MKTQYKNAPVFTRNRGANQSNFNHVSISPSETLIEPLTSLNTPPAGDLRSDIEVSQFLYIPARVTASINLKGPDEIGEDGEIIRIWGDLIRYTTDTGESIWGLSHARVARELNTRKVTLQVRVDGAKPLQLAWSQKPRRHQHYAYLTDLHPVPVEYLPLLPKDVSDEVRLNLAGQFAGARSS